MTHTNAIDRLVTLLAKLPGVGKKSARRITYHILDTETSYAIALADELSLLHKTIFCCNECGGYTETNPCHICTDLRRDRSIICVIERAADIRIIEESHEFNGIFHVLGGLIAPLEGITTENLSIDKLLLRIKNNQNTKEIILALNPTLEGDTTALYLQKVLKEYPVEVTRLASGMPVGGDIEYIDRLTLSRSLRGRIKF